jgi:DNA-binding transcriptional regulator YdaS (Cro superfamily)
MTDAAESRKVLDDVIREIGSQSALARLIGISQPAVSGWVRKALPIPPEHVLTIEGATGISRHRLRPDVYGPMSKASAVSSADIESIERAR